MRQNHTNVRKLGLAATACGALAFGMFAGGCNNAGQGALSGATLGALAGMAIGSTSGDMGKGAAIGAAVGGVGGAVIGDQNQRNSRTPSGNEW